VSRILLLRHGQSTWNAERRWQGWADPSLSDVGRAQARRVVAALLDAGIDAVVASDLARARETAAIVADGLGLGDVEIEPGLRERNVGAWSGLTSEEIEAKWPGQLDAWRGGTLAVIPDGEGDISERVAAAVMRVLLSHPGGTVLAVTHGGVIRSMEQHLGVARSNVKNVGGRWVSLDGDGQMLAGDVVVLHEPGAPAPTTTVL
jgi:broad specificity phosphatase PhoE